MLYATYLAKNSRLPEATKQLERATESAGENAFTHNNIGMVYFDMKDYDKALVMAHKSIDLGFPQTTLREQLQSVGKWSEPPDKPLAAVPPNKPASEAVSN